MELHTVNLYRNMIMNIENVWIWKEAVGFHTEAPPRLSCGNVFGKPGKTLGRIPANTAEF
jgi:hypothetical protein